MSINDIQKNFKDLIDSNDKLLDSALKKYSNSKTPLLNNAEEQILNNIEKKALEKQEPNISRCPFFKKQHKVSFLRHLTVDNGQVFFFTISYLLIGKVI